MQAEPIKTRATVLNQCPSSAKSGLVLAKQRNDRTEATLPDAEPDDRSRPGPKLPVRTIRQKPGLLTVRRQRKPPWLKGRQQKWSPGLPARFTLLHA